MACINVLLFASEARKAKEASSCVQNESSESSIERQYDFIFLANLQFSLFLCNLAI